jgi:opacity protein-like surface antigen
MRNIIFILVALTITCTLASAQEGEKRIGLSAGLSTEFGTSAPQLGITFGYNFTERFGIIPSFDYYFYRFHETKFKMWDINADVRYTLFTDSKFTAYPLAGIVIRNADEFGIGANLGAGVDYELSGNIDLVFNAKYQFTKYLDHALFSIGANYKF